MSTAPTLSLAAVALASDLALLQRYAQERDEVAFAEIVRRYAGMVYASTFRVLRDRQLAEDAAQETFLKLMRRPDSVSVSLGGWLHRAATQLAIDVSRSEIARRNRERKRSEEKLDLLDDQVPWSEVSEVLDLAMMELPDDARDLLVQHFIRGRPQKDLAEERGVSIATVCRRVADAMEQLRVILRRRGASLGACLIVGDFLALRGSEALPITLQQELGKMKLLAGVRHGWKLARPHPRPGLAFMQMRELELTAVVVVAAMLVILMLIMMLGRSKGGGGQQVRPETHVSLVR